MLPMAMNNVYATIELTGETRYSVDWGCTIYPKTSHYTTGMNKLGVKNNAIIEMGIFQWFLEIKIGNRLRD